MSNVPVYVRGFIFTPDFRRVGLVRTDGLLDGVFGEYEEEDNTPRDAMARVFAEDLRVSSKPDDWKRFCILFAEEERGTGREYETHVFFCVRDFPQWPASDEEMVEVPISLLHTSPSLKLCGDVRWLVAMALAVARGEEDCVAYEIEETIRRRTA